MTVIAREIDGAFPFVAVVVSIIVTRSGYFVRGILGCPTNFRKIVFKLNITCDVPFSPFRIPASLLII